MEKHLELKERFDQLMKQDMYQNTNKNGLNYWTTCMNG